MQKVYATIFNKVYRMTSGWSEGTRIVCLFFCCAFLVWQFFFGPDSLEGVEMGAKGLIITLLMLVFSINGKMSPFKWNRAVYYPMILFGLGILIINQLHSVGEGFVLYGIDLIFVFPAFYYVWNCRGDHETLYRIISSVLLISGIISFCFCLILAFKGNLIVDGARVSGHKTNPNYLGMMGVVILISGLYLLFEYHEKKLLVITTSAGIGIGISYLIISVSRTSMIAAIVCILALLIFSLKRRRLGICSLRNKKMLALTVAVTIGIFITLGTNLNDINQSSLQENNQGVETEEQTSETDESEAVAERLGAEGKTADRFSSGRISIWKVYYDNITMLGKPITEIKDDLEGLTETRAHNNFLEYYYRCGYIVGTIYLLFFITMGISGLRYLFGKNYFRPKDLFVVMCIGTYAVFSMLEITMLPFIRIIPCIYFLTIAPIFKKA